MFGYPPKVPTAHVPPIATSVQEAAKAFTGKILIVGAGSSGMFAAYTLQFMGIENYEILEAHAYYGGRVQEMNKDNDDFCQDNDVPLDLGAEWIHMQPRVLQDLLLYEHDKKKVADSIRIINYRPRSFGVYKNGKRYRRNWLRLFYNEYKFLDSTWLAYFRDYVYPYIADKLHLNAVVQTIDTATNPDLVQVITKDGRVFEGTHVIVATPVSILQQGVITFIPPMPREKHLGWDSVDFAPGLKMWIEFDEHFYPDYQFLGSVKDFFEHYDFGDNFYFDALFQKPSSGRHVLALLLAGGESGTTAERVAMNDEQLLATVLAELDQMFDGKATKHYVKSKIKNWSADPYIRGVYTVNDYGMERMQKPEANDRVYFCGEYLADGEDYQGTVHGAALSGREVVQNIILDAARKKTSSS
jgi:monoamine oxidase